MGIYIIVLLYISLAVMNFFCSLRLWPFVCIFDVASLKGLNLHKLYSSNFFDLGLQCDHRSSDTLNTVFHL